MNNVFRGNLRSALGIGSSNGGTRTTTTLNSAMVFGVSGAAIEWQFIAPTTTTLTDFYFFTTASTGTAGNVTVEVRAATGPGSTHLPTSSVLATTTVAWQGTANKWNHAQFASPPSLTAGTTYHVVISNAAGTPASNFPTILQGSASENTLVSRSYFEASLTVSGFSTAGNTNSVDMTCGVLKFADGTIVGDPYTEALAATDITVAQGIKLDSLPVGLKVHGISLDKLTNATAVSLDIYEGNGAPGSALLVPEISIPLPGNSTATTYTLMFPEVTLKANTIYRFVLKPVAEFFRPSFTKILDYSTFADVQAAAAYGGKVYNTFDNGAGGWTDQPDFLPCFMLHVSDIVSGSAGTGGGGILGG
jgi:hypothetical protein